MCSGAVETGFHSEADIPHERLVVGGSQQVTSPTLHDAQQERPSRQQVHLRTRERWHESSPGLKQGTTTVSSTPASVRARLTSQASSHPGRW